LSLRLLASREFFREQMGNFQAKCRRGRYYSISAREEIRRFRSCILAQICTHALSPCSSRDAAARAGEFLYIVVRSRPFSRFQSGLPNEYHLHVSRRSVREKNCKSPPEGGEYCLRSRGCLRCRRANVTTALLRYRPSKGAPIPSR